MRQTLRQKSQQIHTGNSQMEKYGSPINKECLSSGIIKYMQTKISCGALSDYQSEMSCDENC